MLQNFQLYWKKTFLQFSLLLWKNFMLQFRRPVGTIVEIIFPMIGVFALVLLRLALDPSETSCFSTFDAISLQFDSSLLPDRVHQSESDSCKFTYFYTPNSPEITSIMQRTIQVLAIPNLTIDLVPAANEQEIEQLSLEFFSRINASDFSSTNPYICQRQLERNG